MRAGTFTLEFTADTAIANEILERVHSGRGVPMRLTELLGIDPQLVVRQSSRMIEGYGYVGLSFDCYVVPDEAEPEPTETTQKRIK